jgi:hypothetical protein
MCIWHTSSLDSGGPAIFLILHIGSFLAEGCSFGLYIFKGFFAGDVFDIDRHNSGFGASLYFLAFGFFSLIS